MVMKKIMENFNSFVNEETQLPDFRFGAIMTNISKKERGKQDILNDIRSLPGVTVVYVKEADKPRPGEDYSFLSLKVDRYILGHSSARTIINNLVKRISKIEGVKSFAIKGLPEQL